MEDTNHQLHPRQRTLDSEYLLQLICSEVVARDGETEKSMSAMQAAPHWDVAHKHNKRAKVLLEKGEIHQHRSL